MVVVYKRYKQKRDLTPKQKQRYKEFVGDRVVYLKDTLARKRQELADAEWNDEMPSTIARLRFDIEILERKIAMGETIEMPF